VRTILCVLLLTLSGHALPANSGEFVIELSVDTVKPIGPVNPFILGNNLQWVDRGDEMFQPGGRGPAPAMLERAKTP
jgi:hypothetical protein